MRSNLVKLLLGNGLGQAIQLGSVLVLSRLYGPDAHGVLGQIQSYATVLAIVTTLQLHLSLPLARDPDEARMALGKILWIVLLSGAAATLLVPWMGARFAVATMLAMCIGASNALNGYLTYSGSFGKISRFYVVRALLIVAVQVGMALAGVEHGLVWGAVLGEALTALYLARVAGAARAWQAFSAPALLAFVRARQAFAVFGTVQELVSVSAFFAPLFLFAAYYGDAVAGQYAMASRLIWAPAVLVAGSLAQVLYHAFAGARQQGRVGPAFLLLPHRLYYVALLLAPFLCYLMREIIVVLLGAQWRLAADIMPVMLAWACLFIASTPARVVCRMLAQQKFHLLIDLCMLGSIFSLIYFLQLSALQSMYGIFLIACGQNLALAATSLRAIGRAEG